MVFTTEVAPSGAADGAQYEGKSFTALLGGGKRIAGKPVSDTRPWPGVTVTLAVAPDGQLTLPAASAKTTR